MFYLSQPMGNHKSKSKPVAYSNGSCHVTGKVCFPTKRDAKYALKQMFAAGASGVSKLTTYPCVHCSSHHIGTKTIDGIVVPRSVHKAKAIQRVAC